MLSGEPIAVPFSSQYVFLPQKSGGSTKWWVESNDPPVFFCTVEFRVNPYLDFVSLGQFMHEPKIRIFNERPGKDPKKPEASMEVKGQNLVVTR